MLKESKACIKLKKKTRKLDIPKKVFKIKYKKDNSQKQFVHLKTSDI